MKRYTAHLRWQGSDAADLRSQVDRLLVHALFVYRLGQVAQRSAGLWAVEIATDVAKPELMGVLGRLAGSLHADLQDVAWGWLAGSPSTVPAQAAGNTSTTVREYDLTRSLVINFGARLALLGIYGGSFLMRDRLGDVFWLLLLLLVLVPPLFASLAVPWTRVVRISLAPHQLAVHYWLPPSARYIPWQDLWGLDCDFGAERCTVSWTGGRLKLPLGLIADAKHRSGLLHEIAVRASLVQVDDGPFISAYRRSDAP